MGVERKSVGCAACGACCDPVIISDRTSALLEGWSTQSVRNAPDPADDAGWAWWRGRGWPDDQRENVIAAYDPDGDLRADADFAATHWTVLDRAAHPLFGDNFARIRCDAFDAESRRCTAHQDRPPVCRGYPWFGAPSARRAAGLPRQCSYLLDLPVADRPAGARPLTPPRCQPSTSAGCPE
jgi:Fe-S-cluster containining protein